MFEYRFSQNARKCGLRRLAVMVIVTVLLLTFVSNAVERSDADVVAFFKKLENSFHERDFSHIVKSLHKDFYYVMTYVTDDKINFLESDMKDYRKNVGSFFLSKPDIYEYSITVEDDQRFGEDIMVLIKIKSVVGLYGIINSCEASSNYHLQYIEDHLVIRGIRGDATCFNTKIE